MNSRMNSQRKRYVDQGLEESRAEEPLFLGSWDVTLSRQVDIFTNQETP